MGGDTPYATTRSAKKLALKSMVDYRKYVLNYANVSAERKDAQAICVDNWIKWRRPTLKVVEPLGDSVFLGLHENMHPIHDGWNPIQKAPLRLAFYSWFKRCPALIHQSYNAGDTGISDAFENLLQVDFEGRKFRSVRGLYAAIERGEVHL
jgi:hypothetical protein